MARKATAQRKHDREHKVVRNRTSRVRTRPPFECIALLLQGGGALGAYQAGVYQALAEADLHLDWGRREPLICWKKEATALWPEPTVKLQ